MTRTAASAGYSGAGVRAGFGGGIQYEPVAAGTDYEGYAAGRRRVLVVDIGGGTADAVPCC